MPDNVVLYGPGGASPVNLGSWLRADPGADYGARGLVQAVEAESFADGGQFVYDRAGVRHMAFPLRLASGGAGLSLTQLESLVRLNARPGGYLDVQPEGVASAEAVRFDLVHGRWEPDYSVYMQRAGRREGALLLDTQPYGYWPTWITLASAASVMSPGRLPVRAASVIGDAPAPVRLVVLPHEQGAYPSSAVGTVYRADFLAWSIGGGPSVPTFLPGGSWLITASGAGGGQPAGTYFSSPEASTISGSPTIARYTAAVNTAVFSQLGAYTLDARAQGRHRVFGWFRWWGGNPSTIQVAVDCVGASYPGAFASAAPVASITHVASLAVPTRMNASGFGYPYVMADLGEVQIPNVPGHDLAFPSYQMQLRLWSLWPNTTPTEVLDFAGAYLLPVDGPAGYIPAFLNQPSAGVSSPFAVGVAFDTAARSMTFRSATAASAPIFAAVEGYPARHYQIGGLPYLGASDTNVNVILEDRRLYSSATSWAQPPMRAALTAARVSVAYRPTFQFLKGL